MFIGWRCLFYVLAVITLHFEASTYSVNEGMSVSVCFMVEDPPPSQADFQFQFNVIITSSEESAQGIYSMEGEGGRYREGKGREGRDGRKKI